MKAFTCRCGTTHDLNVSLSCPECGAEPYRWKPKHVRYVEQRMLRGEHARNVGRELWGALNRALDVACDEVDDELAGFYARCLVYLTRVYDSSTATDPYQGRRTR